MYANSLELVTSVCAIHVLHAIARASAMAGEEGLDWLLDSEAAALVPPDAIGGRKKRKSVAPTEADSAKVAMTSSGSKKNGKASVKQRRLARPVGKCCTVCFV